MDYKRIINHITFWLKDYAIKADSKGFVIGISGGIDSALTSFLCAQTGMKVICLEMGIHQKPEEVNRGMAHISFLEERFPNVSHLQLNLTDTFETLKDILPENAQKHGLSMANTRARLRMTSLYAIAQSNHLLVAGTGNKVEDFGVGFFTKYGDGGVDLSPIADLTKSDVFALSKEIGIIESIMEAQPTDGLWKDERTDEGQLGATYPELEWAMDFEGNESILSNREKEVLEIYQSFHTANKHKMNPIPVCLIPESLK